MGKQKWICRSFSVVVDFDNACLGEEEQYGDIQDQVRHYVSMFIGECTFITGLDTIARAVLT